MIEIESLKLGGCRPATTRKTLHEMGFARRLHSILQYVARQLHKRAICQKLTKLYSNPVCRIGHEEHHHGDAQDGAQVPKHWKSYCLL